MPETTVGDGEKATTSKRRLGMKIGKQLGGWRCRLLGLKCEVNELGFIEMKMKSFVK